MPLTPLVILRNLFYCELTGIIISIYANSLKQNVSSAATDQMFVSLCAMWTEGHKNLFSTVDPHIWLWSHFSLKDDMNSEV